MSEKLKHSPEPWLNDGCGNIRRKDGDWIAEFADIEDADRAETCVNALAGVEAPETQVRLWREDRRHAAQVQEAMTRIKAAEQSVRELVEAAKDASRCCDGRPDLCPEHIRLAAAIRKFDQAWKP